MLSNTCGMREFLKALPFINNTYETLNYNKLIKYFQYLSSPRSHFSFGQLKERGLWQVRLFEHAQNTQFRLSASEHPGETIYRGLSNCN